MNANGREILFEFRPIGAQMRVTAIDGKTGIEVVIAAPRNANQNDVKKIATAKLMRKMEQLSAQ